MKRLPLIAFASLWIPTLAAAGGAEILLDANFDDKPLDLPIATGGAAAGEPVFVTSTITATVRTLPLVTASLKIDDDDLYESGFAKFRFLEDRYIDTGTLTIRATIWLQALEEYEIRVRYDRASDASRHFLDLVFGSAGTIRFKDRDTADYTLIAGYELEQPYSLVITFDMDADTYDVEFDGALILDDEPHGVVTYGIGALYFGQSADEDDDGEFSLDDLLVTWVGPSSVETQSWAAAKAAYRASTTGLE